MLRTRISPLDQDSTSPQSLSKRHSQNASSGEAGMRTLPCDPQGPVGESQNHSSRVTPDHPAFQRLTELEGTLPLPSNPTPSFCSSNRNSPGDQGHGAASGRAGMRIYTHAHSHSCAQALRSSGSPGYHPARPGSPAVVHPTGHSGYFFCRRLQAPFVSCSGLGPELQ